MRPVLNSGFLRMKRLGVPPAHLLVPICTPGWREALWEWSVLPKNTTQWPRPRLEPGPLDPESSALTMRPPRLHSRGAYKYTTGKRYTACILSRLCPIFIMVCSTFCFSALQIVVLYSLESIFTGVRLHLFFSFGLVPLADKILRGLENTTG